MDVGKRQVELQRHPRSRDLQRHGTADGAIPRTPR
jgi:hypothetical protein